MPAPNNKAPNGKALTKRVESIDSPTAEQLMELPPWLAALRNAISESVKPDDIGEIMAVQVSKAKEGDVRAAGFVLRQVERMTVAARPQITVTQNNYYDGEENRPEIPAQDAPKTEGKIERMSRRASAGMPLQLPGDRSGFPRPMSDDEEKEFRRRRSGHLLEGHG